ncbi:MAG: glycosyltransferase family 4 protein [Promethearchaeota archaeon]
MHTVLLSVEYPPFICGGVGTFAKNLATGLYKEGVKVTVISGYPVSFRVNGFKTDEEKDAGLTVIRFPYFDFHPKDAIFQLQNLKKICETVEKADPDVVHGQGLSTFPASIKLRNLAPLVVTFHSSPKAEKTMGVSSLLRGGSFDDFRTNVIGYPAWSYVCKKELSDSNKSVAVSEHLKLELLEEMGEAYREKLRDIHNGVDIETLDAEYNSVEENIDENNETILFAGRLVWRKGALSLIRMAYLLQKEKPSFKLIVHGDGPLFKTLKRKVADYGLTNIELKGFTNRLQMMRSMKRSKFVVIPSSYEACPMILLESMCLGKIPVMFNLPFALEFTDYGKYAIIAKDVEDMVEKLSSVHVKFDLSSYSDKVKDFARRKYDIKKMCLKYLDLYRSTID